MSLSYLNQFPAEKIISLNLNTIQLSLLFVCLFELMLLQVFLDRKRIYSFFLGLKSQFVTTAAPPKKKIVLEQENASVDHKISSLSGGDLEIVFRSLGMFPNEKLPVKVDADEISDIFEETNASLDEVRQAFEVFDGNRDGFVDAEDLQKVLCALGFSEGLEMEQCRRMIGVFDENGDGRVDFDEFVKLMENSSIC